MTTLHLVSCVGLKSPSAAPAQDLYRSPWFRKARAYVERQGGPWYILSAEYGLLDPLVVTPPYEKTLNTMPRSDRRAWAQKVLGQLDALPTFDMAVFLAGARYREDLLPALQLKGIACRVPMAGLGIGEQLSWLTP